MKLFDFKKLLMAFVLCLMLPLGVSLTACGGGDSGSGGGGGGQTSQITHIDVSVEDAHYDATTNGFVYTYGEEITIQKTAFTVTAYKYDGTTITVNQDDFTIEASGFSFDGAPDVGYYSVNVTLSSNPALNAPVSIQIKEAKIVIPQYSAEELSLVYNGHEQNIITGRLDGLLTTAGLETVSHMIETGKLSIDASYSSDTYRYAATNVQADNNEYFFYLQASSNYSIFASENEQGNGATNMLVSWKIAPKPLNAPTLSQDEVVFDWDVGTSGLYAKTASVSLVFGTGNDDVKENMVTYDREALSSTSCSTHSVYVQFNQDYALNYRFAGDNGDTESVSLVWELVPYTLANGAIALTGNTGTYVDTDESVYPSYPYSADFVPSTNLTLKEMELFNFEDEGANHNHFANQEGNELYSYTVSLAFGAGIYANCIKIGNEIYDGNGFWLHYHIARIDAPQAVQEAISNVSFEIEPQTYDPNLTLTRLFNGSVGSTYCMDKDALTAETQTSLGANWISSENYDADVSKLAYVENVAINEANETGYTIPLSFYYGFYNYNPIAVSAKLVVNRAQREINNLVYTLSDNNNGKYGYIMYRYNSPIVLAVQELSIWGEDDVTLEMSPTTTYYYSATQNGEYTQAADNNALNVGFYKATITVTTSGNYTFVLDEDYTSDGWTITQGNDAETWLLTRVFEILKRPVYVGYSLGGTWGDTWTPYSFYVANEPKTINVAPEDIKVYYFSGSGDTSMSYKDASAEELNDINANMTVTTSDSNKQVTTTPTAVGTYRSMIDCTISSNYTFITENYYDGETHISTSDTYTAQEVEWEILSRTVDASGVTWDKTSFTCLDDKVLHPVIQNLPKGATVSYEYSYWYNSQHYTSTSAPDYGCSDYKIRATISVYDGVPGYGSDITITYPTGYDTTNDYLEQSYTINQKVFDYTIANFAVVLSHDSAPHGEIVATFDSQGKANVNIEYFANGETRMPRVVLVKQGENGLVIDDIYSFNDDWDEHDENDSQYGFPQAGDAIGTSKKITGTMKTWDSSVVLTNTIQFEITWTIVKKTLSMSFTDYSAYLVVDSSDDILLQQFSSEFAQGSTLSATVGVPYSENTQYVYISAYEYQYKNIAISGIATTERDGKTVIPISNVDRDTLIEGIVLTITPNTTYCNSTFSDGSQSITINITFAIY